MLPYLHFGSFSVPTFGIFLWLGGVVGAYVLHRDFVRNGIKADAVSVVALAMIAGVIGAKAWHELQNPAMMLRMLHQVFEPGFKHPLDVLGGFISWFREGFAWFGGLLAGIAMLMYQGWTDHEGQRTGAVRMLDLCASAAAVGYGVGRIGCLTSGDGDYGIVTKVPWGVHMKDNALDPPRPNPPDLLVHPTPIYELIFAVALGAYLWVRGKKNLPIGQLTGEYLFLSGIGRYAVEFIRRNPKIYLGGTTTNAQMAALLSCVAGLVLIGISLAKNKRHLDATAA